MRLKAYNEIQKLRQQLTRIINTACQLSRPLIFDRNLKFPNDQELRMLRSGVILVGILYVFFSLCLLLKSYRIQHFSSGTQDVAFQFKSSMCFKIFLEVVCHFTLFVVSFFGSSLTYFQFTFSYCAYRG